ncbi:MAG: tetratricopeptide repeat protein [Mariprofundales bacterium]
MRATLFVALLLLLTGCAGSAAHEKSIKQGQVHYEMGVDALRKGNLPIAFRELIKAQSFEPDNADIIATLALAWRYRGDFARSSALYRQALQRNPTPSMHNNYGILLVQMKDLTQASKQFNLALADPSYIHQDMAFINLGGVLLAQKKYDEAIAAYRKAGMINPTQTLSKLREAEAFIASHREAYAEALLLTMLREQVTDRAALEAVLPLLKLRRDASQATALLHHYIGSSALPNEKKWAQQQLRAVEAWDE